MLNAKAIITGSAGYVGSRLATVLGGQAYSLVGIDRAESTNPALQTSIQCDLLDSAQYESAVGDSQMILHLAAAKGDWGISEAEYVRDNVEATRALIAAGQRAGIRRWLFYSTVSALGPSADPLPEDATPRPINDYGRSKLECEELFHELAAQHPASEIIIIRPSVVFGPANPWNTNIFRLIDAIYRRRFVMIGDGAVLKTTSYIDNLVAATVFLMDQFTPGVQIFHYLDEPVMSTERLVEEIYRLLNRRRPLLRLPLGLTRRIARVADLAADWAGRDLPITSARIEKFCTDTNFSSVKIRDVGFRQPVANSDALASTVRWYLNQVVSE